MLPVLVQFLLRSLTLLKEIAPLLLGSPGDQLARTLVELIRPLDVLGRFRWYLALDLFLALGLVLVVLGAVPSPEPPEGIARRLVERAQLPLAVVGDQLPAPLKLAGRLLQGKCLGGQPAGDSLASDRLEVAVVLRQAHGDSLRAAAQVGQARRIGQNGNLL